MKQPVFQINIKLFLTITCMICCVATVRSQQKPKTKQLVGKYIRNTAKGWTTIDKDTELIPEIPRYQFLELKRAHRFIYEQNENTAFPWPGKWKVKSDTLILTFNNKTIRNYKLKPIRKYKIYDPEDGACLKPIEPNQSEFCRVFNQNNTPKRSKNKQQ